MLGIQLATHANCTDSMSPSKRETCRLRTARPKHLTPNAVLDLCSELVADRVPLGLDFLAHNSVFYTSKFCHEAQDAQSSHHYYIVVITIQKIIIIHYYYVQA